MTQAWFLGAQQAVPQSEMQVRSTIQPLRDDEADAQLSEAPDVNQVDTDSSGQLTGLPTRDTSGYVEPSEKYAPWWADAASTPHNILVDQQVSSSGTAAAREMAGQAGHGTMQIEISLEPEISDGRAFGNDYFSAYPAPIQEGAGDYLSPVADPWINRVAAARAVGNSRKSFQASTYDALFA